MFNATQGHKKIAYIGETPRSGHLLSRDHVSDLENRRTKSVIYKHIVSAHIDEKDEVSFMKITGKFTNSLGRQLDEGLRIRNADPSLLLNSKAEFQSQCVKRKVYENCSTPDLASPGVSFINTSVLSLSLLYSLLR